jgi:outer membrane lipoprotein-sorting protein
MKYLGLAVVLTCACAHVAPPASLGDLTTKMQAARSSVQAFSADARITYFGKQGRAKGGATLVVSRPASLRYELHGPHGGVLQAFATNGSELQLLDFQENHFIYGPATPTTIDKLMQFAPLHRTAAQWVDMMFGEVAIPPGADVGAEKSQWLARWTDSDVTREVLVDPKTAQVSRVRTLRGLSVLSDVSVTDYDVSGVPTALHIVVPSAEVDIEIRLRDLTINPELDPTVFTLDAPAAMTPERIEDS